MLNKLLVVVMVVCVIVIFVIDIIQIYHAGKNCEGKLVRATVGYACIK